MYLLFLKKIVLELLFSPLLASLPAEKGAARAEAEVEVETALAFPSRYPLKAGGCLVGFTLVSALTRVSFLEHLNIQVVCIEPIKT